MRNFLRMLFKAKNLDRSASPIRPVDPEPLIPSRLVELFTKQNVWLEVFDSDNATIPDGCNFTLWFESDRSPEELLKAFKFKKWQAQVGNSGFTLTQIVPINDMRTGRTKDYQINMAAMVTVKPSCLSVLAGNCTYPESIGIEFRQLVLRLEGQSNNLFCLYVKGGALWREIPASAELLGMDANSLSDADSAVLNTGYIVQIDDTPASCSSVQQLQSKIELISTSVVTDEEGYTHITCWPYPCRRLWSQVQEVELYPEWWPNFMFVNKYIRIKGDSFDDFIGFESKGLADFIKRLNILPGFPMIDFELSSTKPDNEVVWRRSDGTLQKSVWLDEEVVWRRSVDSLNEAKSGLTERRKWGQMGRCPICQFSYRWDGVVCLHCGYLLNS